MPPAGFIKIDSSNSTTTAWQRTTRRRMARTGGVVDRGQRPRVKNCTLACCTSAPLSIVAGLTTLSIVRLLCPTTESALPRGPEPGEEAVVARRSHAVFIPFEPCRSHAKRRTLRESRYVRAWKIASEGLKGDCGKTATKRVWGEETQRIHHS